MSKQIDPYEIPTEFYTNQEVELLYDKTERFYALIKEAKIQIETRLVPDTDSIQSFSQFVRLKYRFNPETYSPLKCFDFECYLNSYLSDKRYNTNGKINLDGIIKSLEEELGALAFAERLNR